MNGKYINKEGAESLYYMGCYGIGVSRTLAALYEQCTVRDNKELPCGFVLPNEIAPFKVQIVVKVENEGKLQTANKIYELLYSKGIFAIIDDRENISLGAKIKDVKVLGTPYMIVIGDKQEGTNFELENNKTGNREILQKKQRTVPEHPVYLRGGFPLLGKKQNGDRSRRMHAAFIGDIREGLSYFTFHTFRMMPLKSCDHSGVQTKRALLSQAYLLSAGASKVGAARK